MGVHWFSATQVETYLLCSRKWAWYKVAGIVAPPGPSLALGSAVHAQLEAWLRDGKPLDLLSEPGQIALSGLHLLPAPGTPGLVVEQSYTLTLAGHNFRGAKDWQLLERRPAVVGDHKTTKDFRWAKTEEDLRSKDIQAALYATHAMLITQHPEVDLQWTYFRTSGARAAQRVHLRVTADDVVPTLERVIKACDEMVLILRAGARAEEVPINPDACEAFGGCTYKSNCNLTPEERFRAIMNQQATADFLAKLQGRVATPGAPVGAINPPEAVHAQQPPPGQPWWDAAANTWRAPDGTPIPAAPAAAPAHPPPPPAQPIWDGIAQTWRDPATGQPIPPPPSYPVQSAPPAPAPAAPPPPAEAPAPAPKRGPGRPRKNGAEAPPAQPAPTPMQAPPPNMGQQVVQQAAAQGVYMQPQSAAFLQAAGEALGQPGAPRVVDMPSLDRAAADMIDASHSTAEAFNNDPTAIRSIASSLLKQASRLIETAGALVAEL